VSDSAEFRRLLETDGHLDSSQIDRVVIFREEVLKENEIQNLTRLLSPKDFYEGHVLDVIHLENSGFLRFPALDLGAGMGVPGILHALIYSPKGDRTWISCDSEAMKADFARRTIDFFNLEGLSAESMRGEDYLNEDKVESIIARAVGPVSRIYGWFRNRSTWNTLLLFKGPRWSEEWAEFEKSPHKGRLGIDREYDYVIGAEKKTRKLIQLSRK
jgi:16S rRNA G527 N7-methylase RsmG